MTVRSFVTYNPFESKLIGADQQGNITGSELIPGYMHLAVQRAKSLVSYDSFDQLRKDGALVSLMIHRGLLLRTGGEEIRKKLKPFCGDTGLVVFYRDICMSGDRHHFEGNKWGVEKFEITGHRHLSAERWSELFAVLALSIAGDLYNRLWPSEDFIKFRAEEKLREQSFYDEFVETPEGKQWLEGEAEQELSEEDAISEELSELEEAVYNEQAASDALQSVGLAEGILIGLMYTKEKKTAGSMSPKKHQEMYEQFISWAISLPANSGFVSTEDAVNMGFKQFLKDENSDLYGCIGATTHRRLKKYLEEHCRSKSLSYPFPRKRSKQISN